MRIPSAVLALALLCSSAVAQMNVPECGTTFEPVMFPIVLPAGSWVNGAHGSRFATEFFGYNVNYGFPIRRGCDVRNPFDGLGEYIAGAGFFEPLTWNDADNPGVMLWLRRGQASEIQFSLHLISGKVGSPDTFNIELPVVHQTDFHAFGSAPIELFPVWLDSFSTRTLLRVYDPHSPSSALVRAFDLYSNREVGRWTVLLSHVLSGQTQNTPGYAEVSLDALLPALATPFRIEVGSDTQGGSVWAFVSKTDNTTQAVTLVTPR